MSTKEKAKKHVCGFCITKNHNQCRQEIVYYENRWECECECPLEDVAERKRERMIEEHYGM